MGFYDGTGMTTAASTYAVAKATQSPVILVVDARGASLSLLATIAGFLDFCPDSRICGVILNRCSSMTYACLAKEIVHCFSGRVRPLGFLPPLPECTLASRHLGLVTAAEVADLRRKMQLLANQAEQTIDLNSIQTIAAETTPVSCSAVTFPRRQEGVRIAIARDSAFCFCYEDSLDALREQGAELVEFSPINDRELPADIHGLYLCGGYPELYAEELSGNSTMRMCIRRALCGGLPCIAECGGFMYLTEDIGGMPMVGFLPGNCFDTGRLSRFGYVTLRAQRDTMLANRGEPICGHEFHRWDCRDTGCSFTAEKVSGKCWPCIHGSDHLYAGFPHFHFYANPNFALRFYNACLKEKHRYGRTDQTYGY